MHSQEWFRAIEHGKHSEIKGLSSKPDCDIDITDTNGATGLHLAIKQRDVWLIDYLIKKGAHMNITNYEGNTPLFTAIKNFFRDRDTFTLREIILDRLLKVSDVRICDYTGRSVLHFIAEKGFDWLSLMIADTILRRNREIINLPSSLSPDDEDKNDVLIVGKTPLHLAVENNNLPMSDFLIKSGADVKAEDSLGATPLHSLFNLEKLSSIDNLSVLLFKSINLIAMNLVANGADAYKKNINGNTPIDLASSLLRLIMRHESNKHQDSMEVLSKTIIDLKNTQSSRHERRLAFSSENELTSSTYGI